jgi:hypothetical protein
MLRKTTPTKTKYKDLFPSVESRKFDNSAFLSHERSLAGLGRQQELVNGVEASQPLVAEGVVAAGQDTLAKAAHATIASTESTTYDQIAAEDAHVEAAARHVATNSSYYPHYESMSPQASVGYVQTISTMLHKLLLNWCHP